LAKLGERCSNIRLGRVTDQIDEEQDIPQPGTRGSRTRGANMLTPVLCNGLEQPVDGGPDDLEPTSRAMSRRAPKAEPVAIPKPRIASY
jgi:hypothetical protein